jgi:hypothetical protein
LAIASGWFVWAKRNALVRTCGAVFAICLSSLIGSVSTDGLTWFPGWLTLFSAYAAMLVPALFLARQRGVRFVCPIEAPIVHEREELSDRMFHRSSMHERGPSETAAGSGTPLPSTLASASGYGGVASKEGRIETRGAVLRTGQFSLASLCAWMTSAALLLGFAQHFQLPAKAVVSLLAFCAGTAAIAFVLLAAASRDHGRLLAALAILLFCPVVGCSLGLTGIPPRDFLLLAAMAVVEGVSIAASITALRLGGYTCCVEHRS